MTMHVTREKRNRFTVRSLMCVDGVGPECAREVGGVDVQRLRISSTTVRCNINIEVTIDARGGGGATRDAAWTPHTARLVPPRP